MALSSGTKLGPYEIQSPLGAGGMGEVYRARDTRLDRIVAIKILPSHLSADSDAKQRFDREARTISSLNHPNICTLFDVGHQDGTDYLVMEYLEGETLADRLRKGPLPLPQLYKVGMEVCDGLDRAHRSGVVHRDLKPGNIMLTKGGAKLMDFGLAKASVVGSAAASSLTVTLTTPAHSHPLTAEGTVVGTFQYMSPEQVEGKESDARSDIFALGAVLYEMATAKRAFEGKSAASAMAAILEREPAPISSITPAAPPSLDRLVKTCLAKDPDERWQTAHDVKLQLKHIADGSSISSAEALAAPRKKHKAVVPWTVAAVCAAVALAAIALGMTRKPETAQMLRLGIVPPEGMEFNVMGDNGGPATLSPDGKMVVFSARVPGHEAQLFVRSLDSTTARPLPGTEDGHFPFWSPDSRSVGFFAPDKMKRIDLDAGSPVSICDDAIARGGTWAPDGNIIAALSYNTGISVVSASGGPPTMITKFDPTKFSSHRWPQMLPDGKHFLYIAVNHTAPSSPDTAVYWASTDGKENHVVVNTLSSAVYADGYLLYERDQSLTAQPLDVEHGKLTGEPQMVRDNVQMDGALWRTNLSASNTGLLLYASGDATLRQPLTWYDRTGKALGTVNEGGSAQEVSLSPDGKRLAITDVNTVVASAWVYDLATKVKNRLSFADGVTRSPVWSPDGSKIAFTAAQQRGIAVKDSSGGAAAQRVLSAPDNSISAVNSWSPDGRYLMFQEGFGLNLHLAVIDLKGDHTPLRFGDPAIYNLWGQFSPDGRWVAYVAIVGSMPQVFVAPFPWTGEKWQVSPGYGIEPRWRGDGKELYFYDSTGIVAVPVDGSGKSFHVDNGTLLFPFSLPGLGDEYDVSRDGQRFIAVTQTGGSTQPLTLVQNWTEQLKKK